MSSKIALQTQALTSGTHYSLDNTVNYAQPTFTGNTVIEVHNVRLRSANSKHYTEMVVQHNLLLLRLPVKLIL